jgi:sialate O-acetylesterase
MRTVIVFALSCCLSCSSSPPPAANASPAPVAPAPTAEASPVAFEVSALFADHMVLQRDRENPIWGWDQPGQLVKVYVKALNNSEQWKSDRPGKDGRWKVMLPALPAGGPYTISIVGSEKREVKDVMVGEVWLASGQSNMEWELARAGDAATAVPAANNPAFRMFTVKKAVAASPMQNVTGAWQISTPENAPRFSAVAYFFGQKLQATLGVPVGIIHSSWGGTPAEAWTSRTALAVRPETKPLADRFSANLSDEVQAKYERDRAEWRAKVYCKDPGNKGFALHYADAEFDHMKWKLLDAPGLWQRQGLAINGAVWFRHPFTVTKEEANGDFELELGPIDDFDETYVNGQKVGGIGPENPEAYRTPRRYKVPKAALKVGNNVIAVRVFDHFGDGGFNGAPGEMRIFPTGNPAKAQPLAGRWRYLVEWSVPYPKDLLGKEPPPPAGPSNQNSPGVLFDGMIAPLVPYGLRGAIWYQGESNVGRAAEYRVLLPTLIGDWRARFGSDFPFYIVQLANFLPRSPVPSDSAWAELRAAQANVAATVPGAGLAVTIDIGEGEDIHPKNKRDAGERLALVALAKTYQKTVEYSGPVLESVVREPQKLRVTFGHADGLALAGNAKKPVGFAIAGADKKFVWADAKLDGKSVVLSNKAVAEPRFVRYAWADNPEVNLVNSAKLPAIPFETEAK